MDNRKYFDDAMCDYADVVDGDKPLMIVSEGKSTLAYETVAMLAERSNLHLELTMLRCEDGNMHEHAFVSSRYFGEIEGTNHAKAAIRLIERNKTGEVTRGELQYYLGRMLGYPIAEILHFVGSAVSRNCPCDCCGGPFVDEALFDEGHSGLDSYVNVGNGADTL